MTTNAQAQSSKLTIKGVVDSIRFQSLETGWVCANVSVDRHPSATIVGIAPNLSPGELVECTGQWTTTKYGKQFKSSHILVRPPVSTDGLVKFLSSGMIDGVGKHYAQKLVNTWGVRLIDILDNNPSKLDVVKGIGKERVKRIAAAWKKHKDVREIIMFLQEHGISATRAFQIHRRYKSRAMTILKKNPYRIAEDITGIGFTTADAIALKMGMEFTSPQRLFAGMKYTLRRFEQQGHCAMEEKKLVAKASQILQVDVPYMEHALEKCLEHGHLIEDTITGEKLVYATDLYAVEEDVAERLKTLIKGKPKWSNIDFNMAVDKAEQEIGLQLSPSQREALLSTLPNKVGIITGGPGTGKTTIVKTLLSIISQHESKISLCAPTGRAARRMAEATGFEAHTIHRLLGARGGHQFTYNKNSRLETVVLVGDEWSMVNLRLMQYLIDALPDDCSVIFVGDVDQLDAVGAGSVLHDMIDSGVIPTVRLTEIHRQAETSDIVLNAHRINNGLMPTFNEHSKGDFQLFIEEEPENILNKIDYLVGHVLPKQYGLDPVKDVQVLAPLHKGDLGTRALNKRLQALINPNPPESFEFGDSRFGVGDKVIQTVNNYDKGVFNGDTGFITTINKANRKLTVEFDGMMTEYDFSELDELQIALCISSHKSQGSEYKAVILPVSNSHYVMLNRRLLYTSVTRGKELVILVGQEKALRTAIKNDRGEKRITGLAERLKH